MLDFHGWEGLALSAEIKFDLKHFREIERLALVGDRQWEKFLGGFARPLTAADMRYFSKGALAEALACSSTDAAQISQLGRGRGRKLCSSPEGQLTGVGSSVVRAGPVRVHNDHMAQQN